MTREAEEIDHGYDFATATGTLEREELSELSDISTKNSAVAGLRTDSSNVLLVFGTSHEHFGKFLSI